MALALYNIKFDRPAEVRWDGLVDQRGALAELIHQYTADVGGLAPIREPGLEEFCGIEAAVAAGEVLRLRP